MRPFLLALLLACGAWGQPAFEAASLKPSKSVDFNSTFNTRSDNVQAQNVELRELLVQAFEIKEYQLVGPEWLSGARFDIVAKAPLGTGDDEKLMPLLRTLLTERFKLQTHREKRELPCFALAVTKDGFKLHEVEAGGSGMSSNSNQNGGELKARKTTMERFAEWLSRQMQRPVIDATSIKGAYDFTLKYSKENANRLAGLDTYPILTLAIQEQLGLRLEKRTAPVDVVVIDHIERVPVEN
jgi:uncharacterized protein (TIGR03435 family)